MTDKAVVLDRAIFTSVRSPMGTGYKVAAASSGVTEDEKREITQRAPSHGNLCDDSGDARAFACFGLRSGRQCFLLSRYAGAEPSGRGGLKVHTDVVVMNAADYRGDRFNPSRVMRAVDGIAENPPVSAATPLSTVSLPRENPMRLENRLEDDDMAGALAALAALLEGRTVAVAGAPDPATVLCDVMCALPAGRREPLACGHGLKVSKQRRLDLMFVPDRAGLGMAAHDPQLLVFDWDRPPDPSASPFAAWIEFVRKGWRGERFERVTAIADELADELAAEDLETVAFLGSKIPTVELLNPSGLDALCELSHEIRTSGPVQRRLHAELEDLIQRRRNAFTPKVADAGSVSAR
jgi:hypothetical protein